MNQALDRSGRTESNAPAGGHRLAEVARPDVDGRNLYLIDPQPIGLVSREQLPEGRLSQQGVKVIHSLPDEGERPDQF